MILYLAPSGFIFVLKLIKDTPEVSLVLFVFPCCWEWIFDMIM